MDHDLIIVGGGAGGLGALRAALWVDADVAMINDGEPGGDCTFSGCVPSKTLLAGARSGLSFGDTMERVSAVVERIASTESAEVLRSHGATFIDDRARIVTHDTVAVGGSRITAPRIVIATGGRVRATDSRAGRCPSSHQRHDLCATPATGPAGNMVAAPSDARWPKRSPHSAPRSTLRGSRPGFAPRGARRASHRGDGADRQGSSGVDRRGSSESPTKAARLRCIPPTAQRWSTRCSSLPVDRRTAKASTSKNSVCGSMTEVTSAPTTGFRPTSKAVCRW